MQPEPTTSTSRREAGFTLVEYMVAISMLMAVLAIAMPTVVQGLRTEPKISHRAAQIAKARVTVERVARELRQGVSIDSATTSSVSFRTYTRHSTCGDNAALSPSLRAIQCQVTYSCTGDSCYRTEGNIDGTAGGPAVLLVEGLLSPDVFTYLPDPADPSYVEVRFSFSAEGGEDAITLDDGIELRNVVHPEGA